MALTFDQLEQEALALPDKERAELAKHLWATLEPDLEVSDEWRLELRRRIEDIDSGRVKLIPGEEGSARVKRLVGL